MVDWFKKKSSKGPDFSAVDSHAEAADLLTLVEAFAKSKADKDVELGLATVQEKWLAYCSLNQKPAEHETVQFSGPFVTPMMA